MVGENREIKRLDYKVFLSIYDHYHVYGKKDSYI